MIDWQSLYNKGMEMVVQYAPKVLLGIITLIIGFWVVKLVVKLTKKAMIKAKVEESLLDFISNLVGILLKVLVLISVASMVGIKMTSFIAILSAMALAVGLALQGSLSNFSGGVLIIILKPFKLGDFIEAQGFTGIVTSIQIFHTVLKTPDNKTIIIPNGPLSNGNIMNYTMEDRRRVDITFGISYDDDFRKAKDIIMDVVNNHDKVIKDPAPFARVGELGDSSVNIKMRIWAKTSDYWDVYFDVMETVKLKFDENNITIPFPQRDVHIFNQNQ